MGAAAGIAAAFSSPLGGILYSLEEVCSHWSSDLTWRSFLCVVIVFVVYNLLIEASSVPWLHVESFVIGGTAENIFDVSVLGGALGWAVILSIVGGVVGALYNTCVFRLHELRAKVGKCFGERKRTFSVVDATLTSIVVLTALFAAPFAFGCTHCPENLPHCTTNHLIHDGGEEKTAEHNGTFAYGASKFHGRLTYVRWQCPEGEFSGMASLMHSGQEGLIKHLLSRQYSIKMTLPALLTLLVLYFCTTVLAFGISIPCGNFIPSMTIGSVLGRLLGELLVLGGMASEQDRGTYALVGAAAVLGGVTRMTITLAVILAEVTDDAHILPATMLTLTVARVIGDTLSHSFDDGMLEQLSIPFLQEAPPRVLDALTARDVMASPVVSLNELARVSEVVNVLTSSPHNCFPVVRLDIKSRTGGRYVCGQIIRRQLLALLHERVWESQLRKEPISEQTRERFLSSFDSLKSLEALAGSLELSLEDLNGTVDLRPFYDASPFTATELMPLGRVFALFNNLGVRSVPVLDRDMRLTGVITRKDLLSRAIMQRLSVESYLKWLSRQAVSATEKRASAVGHLVSGKRPSTRVEEIDPVPGASPMGERASREDQSPQRFPEGFRVVDCAKMDFSSSAAAASASTLSPETARRPGVPMRRRSSGCSNASLPELESMTLADHAPMEVGLHRSETPSDLSEMARSTHSVPSTRLGPPSMHLLRVPGGGDVTPTNVSNRDPNGGPSRRASGCMTPTGDEGDNLWNRLAGRKSNTAVLDILTDRLLDPKTGLPLNLLPSRERHQDKSHRRKSGEFQRIRNQRRGSAPAIFSVAEDMAAAAELVKEKPSRSRRGSTRERRDSTGSRSSAKGRRSSSRHNSTDGPDGISD